MTRLKLREGELLKSKIAGNLESQGLVLIEKHENLKEDKNLPKIVESQPKLLVECKNKTYLAGVPEMDKNTFRTGLCFLYGYGMIKYDYELPVFNELNEKELKIYMKLAIEIWERNIHWDWMQNQCKYKQHNGKKDLKFLEQIVLDPMLAIKDHRARTDEGDNEDTPHHIFRNPYVLRRVILDEGKNKLSAILLESFYDQATAITRIWYKKRNLPFEERLIQNMNEGYYIGLIANKEERWKPGYFGFTNEYESKLWQSWIRVHNEFKKYWIDKFGKTEEFWQPPADMDKISETFK